MQSSNEASIRDRQSSPVRVDGDRAVILQAYFEWLKERFDADSLPHLDAAFAKASEEFLSVELLAKYKTAADWKLLVIPIGLGNELQKQVKPLLSEMQANTRRLTGFEEAECGGGYAGNNGLY